MKAKYAGIAFCAAGLLTVGYFMAHPLLPRAEAQGEKAKAGRYQIVGAGLMGAVLYDPETGKAWALSQGGFMDGQRGMGDGDTEYAWVPITKFDDLESYRAWSKVQTENRMKRERERYKYYDRTVTITVTPTPRITTPTTYIPRTATPPPAKTT